MKNGPQSNKHPKKQCFFLMQAHRGQPTGLHHVNAEEKQ